MGMWFCYINCGWRVVGWRLVLFCQVCSVEGGFLVLCRLGQLLHGHHGDFFFKLCLYLCHTLLYMCYSLRIFCDCLHQRIPIGEVLHDVHGCSISLFPHCGVPHFGELSRVVLYHVGQEFGQIFPILRWPLLPLLGTFGIHSPSFCDFYQFITD